MTLAISLFFDILRSPKTTDRNQREEKGKTRFGNPEAVVGKDGPTVALGDRCQDRIQLIVQHAAAHGPQQKDQGIDLSRGQPHGTRAGAPAAHDKPHTENQTAHDLSRVDGMQKIDILQGYPAKGFGIGDAEHGDNHRRKHDLQHGHVPEVEDACQTPGTAESRLFQRHAESDADEQARQKSGRRIQCSASKKGLNHPTASLQTRRPGTRPQRCK